MRQLSWLMALVVGCTSDGEQVEEAFPHPMLSISSPARASWNADGPTTLTGEAQNLQSLFINGERYPVPEGEFAIPIELGRGIQYLEVEAEGLDGELLVDRRSVIAGDFALSQGPITDVALTRVNQSGLDDVAQIVTEMVDVQYFNQDFSTVNPVVDLDYSMGTGIAIDLKNIYFNEPHIEITTTEDQLQVEITLPNVFVDTDAQVSLLWMESEEDLEFRANYGVIEMYMTVDVQDEVIVIEPTHSIVEFEGFEYDISLLPGVIVEDNVFNENIELAIEDSLAWCMETMIPEILTDLQEELDTEFKVDFLGTEIVVDAIAGDMDVDSNGIWVDLDLKVSAGGSKVQGNGYLYSGSSVPSPDTRADGALVVSDDAINRIIYELWTAGLFSQTLSTNDGSISADGLTKYGIRELTVVTEPGLPPVVIEQNGALQVQLGEVEVQLSTPGFSLGELTILRLSGSIDLDMVYEDGFVRPILGELQIHPDVLETDWMRDEENLVDLLEDFVTPELLLGSLDGITIPIPSIEGLEIEDAEVGRSEDGSHTTLKLNIDPI